MVDWTFTCCNDQQYLSIILITLYAVLILKLWHVSIIHPFKILTVFLHELGHATACWLTCGVVEGMIITPDEGGQTKTRGGIQWIVLPAGYIGSSVWGMGLVIASADQLASEIASGVLMFFLVVFFFYAENKYFRALNFGFVVLLIALLLLNLFTDADPLQYVLLFVGVMSCLFSIYDIWDDLIARRVNESDATAFAKLTHTSSRCWGAIWGLIAVLSLAAAIYFNLLVGEDEGPEINSFGDLSKQVTVVFYIAVVLIGIALAHTLITQRCMVRKRSGFSEYFGRLESPA